jgi:hypothetical protein
MQLMFYAAAAESLSVVQGEIEELSLAAEGEYRSVSLFELSGTNTHRTWCRKSRDH